MNKSQAKKKVFDYFKKNAIEYKFVNEEFLPGDQSVERNIFLKSLF